MSLVLELPVELETELAARAARLQIPLAEYAIRVLSSGGAAVPNPGSGTDLVGYWEKEGLVGTRPDIADASEHARALRQDAQKRIR